MADKQITVETEERNEVVAKAQDFWAKFSKPIIYVGSAVIILIGGWFGYKNFVKAPKEAKASEAIFPAEQLFDKMAQAGFTKDSVNLVLNGGNGISTGILKVASTYSGTAAGNRANYIAGACYLQVDDFNNAIKYLKDFSTPATQIQAAAYGMLGDAAAGLKKNDDAFDYYKKAVSVNPKDEFMTAQSLFKAGLFAENIGKTNDAVDLYKRIRDEFPKSNHSADVEKCLARLGVLN